MSKLALITGAARKLGAEIARALAKNGYVVIIHAFKSISEAEKLASEIRQEGGKAYTFVGDLTDEDVIKKIKQLVIDVNGSLDLLVNNASLFEYDFPGEGRRDLLLRSLLIHAVVPFELIETFSRLSGHKKKLTVFNILDQKLLSLNPDYFSYTIGKAALQSVTEIWQINRNGNARVFGIMPGNIYPSGPQTQAGFERSVKANPLKRGPFPKDVCEAIIFFAENPNLPPQNLAIDSGEHFLRRKRDPAFE